jgi:hypothetical protein
MYCVFIYKIRTVKPAETVLRRQGREIKEKDGGGECN